MIAWFVLVFQPYSFTPITLIMLHPWKLTKMLKTHFKAQYLWLNMLKQFLLLKTLVRDWWRLTDFLLFYYTCLLRPGTLSPYETIQYLLFTQSLLGDRAAHGTLMPMTIGRGLPGALPVAQEVSGKHSWGSQRVCAVYTFQSLQTVQFSVKLLFLSLKFAFFLFFPLCISYHLLKCIWRCKNM